MIAILKSAKFPEPEFILKYEYLLILSADERDKQIIEALQDLQVTDTTGLKFDYKPAELIITRVK